MRADAVADPTGATIAQYGIEEHRDLMLRWGGLIAAKLRGRVLADVRTGQDPPNPLAEEIINAFGQDAYRIRNTLNEYHKASYEAELMRQGIG